MQKIDVTLIIVFYSEKKRLLELLQSIKSHKSKKRYEVIVVNNGDEKIRNTITQILPNAFYIKSPKNGGYGYGNNLGAEKARGKYLFILNPDTKLLPGVIDTLCRYLDNHDDTAVVAPMLVHEDGNLFELQGTEALTPLRGAIVHSFVNAMFPHNPISKTFYLRNRDRTRKQEVGTVPGSAFMIRHDIFKKIGGFDENIFLFFEESDLGKRVQTAGYKIVMHPEAKIYHYWTNRKKGDEEKTKVAAKSRFYYFKKHYGVLSAVFVESFARFSKSILLVSIIVIIGGFLRFWRLGELMNFFPDAGWYYLQARDMLISGNVPLVGIPTSVPILRQGALWTWMLAGALWIGNFNPIAGGYLVLILGLIGLIGTYIVTSILFKKTIGLICTLFIAVSPFVVLHDRIPFETVPIYLITLVIAWYVNEIAKGKDRWFLLGILFAVGFQFELAGFILFIVVGTTLLWHMLSGGNGSLGLPRIYSEFPRILQSTVKLFTGVFWGLLPFWIYDFKNGVFIQTLGFGVWFVTKLIEGIVGLGGKGGGGVNLEQGVEFTRLLIFPWNNVIAIGLLGVLSASLIARYTREKSFGMRLILIWLLLGFSSFFVRGTFSEAYMPLIYFPIAVGIGILGTDIFKKSKTIGILSFFGYFGLLGYYSITHLAQGFYVSYAHRLEVVDSIIKDANGRTYKLNYLGPDYMFESGDNSWKYLLWWKGNEPFNKADLQYTIVEEPYHFEKGGQKEVRGFGSVKVVKKCQMTNDKC